MPLVLTAVLAFLCGWVACAVWSRRVLNAARRDPVTGLPGRAAWTTQARRILRGRGLRTVMLIDLDRFKQVNDTMSHEAGDALLGVVAARLLSWTQEAGGGACGRLGGDEFAVITRRPVTEPEIASLVRLLSSPVTLPKGDVLVSASVGASSCQARHGLPAALAAADAAMYQAKRAGGGGYRTAHASGQPDPSPMTRTRHRGSPHQVTTSATEGPQKPDSRARQEDAA